MSYTKWMAALIVGASLVARADLIDPSSHVGADRPADSNPLTELAFVEGELGLDDLVYLAKVEAEDPDEDPLGLLAGGNITVQNLIDDDDDSADVSWDLSGTGYEMLAVFVKGGQGDTLYRVSLDQLLSSNGTQAATVLDPQRSISHITFFGRQAQAVPDMGHTGLLLGGVFGGMLLARRRMKS